MHRLRFTMNQAPVGKERPRVGKGGHIYTPAKTAKYERELGKLGKSKRIDYGLTNLEPWPMHAGLYVVSVIPYKAANGGPDGDNIFKCIDGLNKILWADDRYVSGSFAKPRISARPRVEYDILAVPMGMVRMPTLEEHRLMERAALQGRIISLARGLEEGEPLEDALRELTALVDLERGSL